jgi:hypothetical protein
MPNVELRPVLLMWEKLRIVYNLVLVVVVVIFVVMEPSILSMRGFPFRLAAAAIGANFASLPARQSSRRAIVIEPAPRVFSHPCAL